MIEDYLEVDAKRNGLFSKIVQKISFLEKFMRDHNAFQHSVVSNDGWLPVGDTWTRASASAFTVPTGAGTVYEKGDFVRWKQGGGFKYGVISVVAATQITILVNTDYTVTVGTITDISYSRALKPMGWPDWFNYLTVVTPSAGAITSYTIQAAKYRCNGLRMDYILDFTITANGTGAGSVRATFPAAIVNGLGGSGRENAVTGNQLQVVSGSSLVTIFTYNNLYPGGTNHNLKVAGFFSW